MIYDLEGPAAVVSEGGFDGVEEVEGGELLVGGAAGPVGFQAEVLAVLEA